MPEDKDKIEAKIEVKSVVPRRPFRIAWMPFAAVPVELSSPEREAPRQRRLRFANKPPRQLVKAVKKLEDSSRQLSRQLGRALPAEAPPALIWGLGALALAGLSLGLWRTLSRRPVLEAVQDIEEFTAPELTAEELSGTWYELARFPHPQEKHAMAIVLNVSQVGEQELEVKYSCDLDGFLGHHRERRYRVRLGEQGHLRLQVFGPLVYDYLLLEADQDYLAVGSADHSHLWILSRQPRMDQACFEAITVRLAQRGYDIARLILVPHGADLRRVSAEESKILKEHKSRLW
ncbi:MAG TPA: lipocalin family protein [Candidatus Obscuribacterales bacterium]